MAYFHEPNVYEGFENRQGAGNQLKDFGCFALGEPSTQVPVPVGIKPITYSPPFPNIKAKMPTLYGAAIAADTAFQKHRWFADLYIQLAKATSNSHPALNNADDVIVIPEETSTTNLLGPKLVAAVLKQSGKALIKELVGADFARFLGVLNFLLTLFSALTLEDRRRLVSEQNRSRRDEARRFKLRFFIRLYIAKVAPQADPVKQSWLIENAFFEHEKILGALWKYQDIEKNLGQGLQPYQRRAPTMGPAP